MSVGAGAQRPSAMTTVDYCTMETLNVTCPSQDQVVVVERARYGRMSLGRCVHSSFGYLGCAVDVRRYLDLVCSGRRHCSMPVPDGVLHATRPCHGDLTSYLQLTYNCLTGALLALNSTAQSGPDRTKPADLSEIHADPTDVVGDPDLRRSPLGPSNGIWTLPRDAVLAPWVLYIG